MTRTVLVTGATGFVGGHLLRHLRERGDHVRALVRDEQAGARLRELGVEVVPGDLRDRAAVDRAVVGADAVVHAAARVDTWGSTEEYAAINVEGTWNVMAAAIIHRVPHVVHVSTEAVLVGGRPIVQADETWPLPARPLGIYPATKGAAERYVQRAARAGLNVSIVRPRFVWGPGDTTVLPRIIDTMKAGRFRWIDGGDYLTSTCHVDNLCEGILCALERGRGGEAWFLTDGPPIVFRDFITRMVASRGVTAPTGSIPWWLAWGAAGLLERVWQGFNLGGAPPIDRTALSLMGREVTVRDDKARREIGYEGRVSIEEGMRGLG